MAKEPGGRDNEFEEIVSRWDSEEGLGWWLDPADRVELDDDEIRERAEDLQEVLVRVWVNTLQLALGLGWVVEPMSMIRTLALVEGLGGLDPNDPKDARKALTSAFALLTLERSGYFEQIEKQAKKQLEEQAGADESATDL